MIKPRWYERVRELLVARRPAPLRLPAPRGPKIEASETYEAKRSHRRLAERLQ